jgi:hypothetical protein
MTGGDNLYDAKVFWNFKGTPFREEHKTGLTDDTLVKIFR